MAVGASTGNISKAMIARWAASGIDIFVKQRRSNQDPEYATIFDTEAPPHTVDYRPFAVFDQGPVFNPRHSSYSTAEARQVRYSQWRFAIHAKTKPVAAEIAERVMEKYDQISLALDKGCAVLVRYESDWSLRESADEWLWIVDYTLVVDSPANP